MIGALIEDIATWTYEHDKDTFYSQLIPNDKYCVVLSDYGKVVNQHNNYHKLLKF